MWFVIDNATKARVGRAFNTRKGAQRMADRLNISNGCHIYKYAIVDINGNGGY